MTNNVFRFTLFKKIAIGSILIGIIPGIIFVYFMIRGVMESTQAEVLERNILLSEELSRQVDFYFQAIQKLLESLAAFPEMQAKNLDLEKANDVLGAIQNRYTILGTPVIKSFTVVDQKGIVETLYPFHKDYVDLDYSYETFYREIADKGQNFYFSSRVWRTFPEAVSMVEVAVPVLDGNGNLIRIIAAHINLASIGEINDLIKIGKTGHAFIVDSEGKFIAHPQKDLVWQQENVNNLIPGLLFKISAQGEKRGVILWPEANPETIYSYSYPQTSQWTVVFEQSLDETLRTLFLLIMQLAQWLVLSFALVGLISFVISRSITNPLRVLMLGIKDFRVGKLDSKIELKTGDELEDLAGAFNGMARELNETVRQLRAERAKLESEVLERTRELQEAKEILEIKIDARTKELKEFAESLEERVRQRTMELQEKVKALEVFRKLTVGRELKMIDLKEQIKKLERECMELRKSSHG